MVEEVDLSGELLQKLQAERHRRPDRRRRRPWAEHPLQAPPQGAQRGVRAPVDRERHRGHDGVLRLQQRAQLHHRDARPGSSGGPVGPQDRRGGGPGRAGRMAGAAGRHRGVRRCRADSRDPLRPAGRGGEVAGQGHRQAAVRAGGGGRRGDLRRRPESPRRQPSSLKASLSPLATGDASDHVIRRSGQAAETVASRLQLAIAEETFPLVLGPWVEGRHSHGRRPSAGAGLRRRGGAGPARPASTGRWWPSCRRT